MKQTYLLIITSAAGAQLKRVVCTSKAQAKRECQAMSGYLATGELYTAKYSEEKNMYIPKQFIKKYII